MAIPKGTRVRQVVPIIEGEVVKTQFNESLGALEYLVDYIDVNGEDAQRWFLESQVEPVSGDGGMAS